ncbi:MAG: hypothetical protein ACREQ9_23135 [Candidatus Binatia bacterium]
MLRLTIGLFSLALVLATPTITAAADDGDRSADLERARQKVARAADRSKGGQRQLLQLEGRRIDRLISELERGESVDPAAIDRALERSQRATW